MCSTYKTARVTSYFLLAKRIFEPTAFFWLTRKPSIISVALAAPASGWRGLAAFRRVRRAGERQIAAAERPPLAHQRGKGGPVCRQSRSARHRHGFGWPPRPPAPADLPDWQPLRAVVVPRRPQRCRRPARAPGPADWRGRLLQPAPTRTQQKAHRNPATSGPNKLRLPRPAPPAKTPKYGATRGFEDSISSGDYHGRLVDRRCVPSVGNLLRAARVRAIVDAIQSNETFTKHSRHIRETSTKYP